MTSSQSPHYMYYDLDGERCRQWVDCDHVPHAERWDEDAGLYLPISAAELARNGVIMSPEALAESLRRAPSRTERVS